MPQKISEREVCRRVADQRREGIEAALEHGISTVRYTKTMFREDMMSEGFIASEPTVSAKWTMLKADGVVLEQGQRTHLHVGNLLLRAGISPMAIKKQKQKKTEAEEAEE